MINNITNKNMKQITLITALFIASLTSAAQSNKHGKKVISGTFNTYTSIIMDGKEIKNPTRLEAIKCMIGYLNNNWLYTSNVYRAKHIHTSINYSPKKNYLNNI